MKNRRIALVHDFLLNYGGAESVLKILGDLYLDAPIYTLLYDREKVKNWLGDREVHASFLQKAPNFLKKRHKFLFPLMPTAPETFNLRDFDVVISSSSSFAKGVIVKPKTTHICYMHCPMRYVWDWNHEYMEEQKLKGKTKLITRLFLNYLRMWDRASSERVDYFIANSNWTAKRIKKYYRKDSQVIYPPVDVSKFQAQKENDGYFLTVARLSPYKRIKLMIDAFNKLKLPLLIVGDGNQRKELEDEIKKGTNDRIKILGWVGDEELKSLYENARAFVFAAEDDFGIVPVEAMAAGKPVIAFRAGGIMETVIEGVTGEFFDFPTVEILADGVRRFIENEKNYDHMKIRARAEEFSRERFEREFREYVEKILESRI